MGHSESDHPRKHWSVEISIEEHPGRTRAWARLHWRTKKLAGVGTARVNPADYDVAEIGDELAVARALDDLASRLFALTASDIEAVTHERVPTLH